MLKYFVGHLISSKKEGRPLYIDDESGYKRARNSHIMLNVSFALIKIRRTRKYFSQWTEKSLVFIIVFQ